MFSRDRVPSGWRSARRRVVPILTTTGFLPGRAVAAHRALLPLSGSLPRCGEGWGGGHRHQQNIAVQTPHSKNQFIEELKSHGWGESVVEMVAADLRQVFPSMSGFSPRNVWYMRQLYETWADPTVFAMAAQEMRNPRPKPILQQPVAELH